ncbi:MAG: DegT/DnrJ/EryC1/StrS family aminotransferase [Lutibacter sp.]|nr:DegT/DnrJ/EryC1/StrS family aminotransferase [Lutibacter sp.]
MIRLSKSVIGKEEIKAVEKVLKKGFLGMGEEVFEFEKTLSLFFESNVVCVNTGTSALHLALQSIGLKSGDEVLVQSITYLASFQAISATGATPVACEVDPHSLTIDLKDAKSKITKNTKAIMPVHYAGSAGNLNDIYLFSKLNNLRVIEDAAHAFGTIYKDKLIGSQGDIICFSFDGIKNITCGEGGAVVSNDLKIINKIKDLRLLGVVNDSEKRYVNNRSYVFQVFEQGWRYHMSNIMAAIGIEQFKKFEKFKKSRQRSAKYYVNNLKNCSQIRLLNLDYNLVVPHIFPIILKIGNRDKVRAALLEKGIASGIHYFPNHMLKYYQSDPLEVSESIYDKLLTLPLHPDLSSKDLQFIVESLKEII